MYCTALWLGGHIWLTIIVNCQYSSFWRLRPCCYDNVMMTAASLGCMVDSRYRKKYSQTLQSKEFNDSLMSHAFHNDMAATAWTTTTTQRIYIDISQSVICVDLAIIHTMNSIVCLVYDTHVCRTGLILVLQNFVCLFLYRWFSWNTRNTFCGTWVSVPLLQKYDTWPWPRPLWGHSSSRM